MTETEPLLPPQVRALLALAPVGELTVIAHNGQPVTSPLTVLS